MLMLKLILWMGERKINKERDNEPLYKVIPCLQMKTLTNHLKTFTVIT